MSLEVLSFATVFASALRGDPCLLWEHGVASHALPVGDWLRPADESDRALLALCTGPTLDIGCGPGRMAQELARRGQITLGIDLVPEAVRQTLERGAAAMVRNLFDPLPAEGRWETALLADGNIGIGGDPRALLQRIVQLLSPEGRAVVDLAPPGIGVHIETRHGLSRPFNWSAVGVDSIDSLAVSSGFRGVELHVRGDRWFAVLRKAG